MLHISSLMSLHSIKTRNNILGNLYDSLKLIFLFDPYFPAKMDRFACANKNTMLNNEENQFYIQKLIIISNKRVQFIICC